MVIYGRSQSRGSDPSTDLRPGLDTGSLGRVRKSKPGLGEIGPDKEMNGQ